MIEKNSWISNDFKFRVEKNKKEELEVTKNIT